MSVPLKFRTRHRYLNSGDARTTETSSFLPCTRAEAA